MQKLIDVCSIIENSRAEVEEFSILPQMSINCLKASDVRKIMGFEQRSEFMVKTYGFDRFESQSLIIHDKYRCFVKASRARKKLRFEQRSEFIVKTDEFDRFEGKSLIIHCKN